LKEDEFLRLAKWLEVKLAAARDLQIDRDSKDGKLDFLFNEADAERTAGELKQWPSTP